MVAISIPSNNSIRSGDNAGMCGRYVSPEEAEIERLDPQISDPVQAMSAALAKSVIEVEHHVVSNRVNTAATDDRQLIEKENLQR